MLVLTRRSGEAIHIGENIKLVVISTQTKGNQVIVKIGIDAPKEVTILREEVKLRNEQRLERPGVGENYASYKERETEGTSHGKKDTKVLQGKTLPRGPNEEDQGSLNKKSSIGVRSSISRQVLSSSEVSGIEPKKQAHGIHAEVQQWEERNPQTTRLENILDATYSAAGAAIEALTTPKDTE